MGSPPETTAERVVHAVAAETGTDPLSLPPLYESVDPGALETFSRRAGGATVTFEYAACTVTVESGTAVQVDESNDAHVSAEVTEAAE